TRGEHRAADGLGPGPPPAAVTGWTASASAVRAVVVRMAISKLPCSVSALLGESDDARSRLRSPFAPLPVRRPAPGPERRQAARRATGQRLRTDPDYRGA